MKYLLFSLFFYLLLSCQNSKQKTELNSSQLKDINEIVRAITIEYNLEALKKDNKNVILSDSLKKTKIYIPSKKDKELGVPTPPDFVTINEIIKVKIKGQAFFSNVDSSHILSQYPDIKKLKISENILSKINSPSFEKEIVSRKKVGEYHFYEIGIPLFSIDNKKAFVELSSYCGGLCGNGEFIFLEKINGKWKIIERFETWIS